VFPIPVGSPSALATRANAVPGVVRTVALAAGVLAAGAVIPALAQATRHEARPAVRAVPPVARDAVTAPVAPDVINRDASGRVAIRATRLDTALTIDGHLDESTYRQVKSFGGFIQQEPQEGRPSSVSTDVWVFFDDQAVYVAARCWQDASRCRSWPTTCGATGRASSTTTISPSSSTPSSTGGTGSCSRPIRSARSTTS
jgi:hypothetical protein